MNSMVSKFMAVWLHPWQAMAQVKEEGQDASIVPSMIFVLVMGVISGIFTAILSMIIPSAAVPGTSKAMSLMAILIVPLVSFIGSFIGAGIIWAITSGLLRGSLAEYKTSYRLLALLAAFSPVTSLINPIPGNLFLGFTVGSLLALLINISATAVMVKGIIIVFETPFVRTIVTCVILFGLLMTVGIAARIAAQRQLQGGPGGFNEFGSADYGASDDLAATSDDLEKQLQELADKAKAEQTKK